MNDKRRPPLGQFIFEKRDAIGLTMKEAGERAGTSGAYWSQIEWGQTKLPGADFRRRIAQAIGVSHLDLLVAAGELTPDEAGVAPASADPVEVVCEQWKPLMHEVVWTPGRVDFIRAALRHFADDDRRWEEDRPSSEAPDPSVAPRNAEPKS